MIPVTPDRSFQYVRDTENGGDLAQIALVIPPVLHDRGPADHFQLSYFGEIVEDLILHTVRKVSVVFVWTDVIEGKDCYAFFGSCAFANLLLKRRSSVSGKEKPRRQTY